MKEQEVKIIVMLGPTFIAPILVAGAVRLAAWTHAAPQMTYINTFAAGLFLGIALFHVFPEATELYCDENEEANFRNLFLSTSAGLLFMLYLDKVWLSAPSRHHNSDISEEDDDLTMNIGVRATRNDIRENNTNNFTSSRQSQTGSWQLTPEHANTHGIIIPACEWREYPRIMRGIELLRAAKSMVLSTYTAFCIHSLIAGIALGAARPSRTIALVLVLFTFHKTIDAIAVTTQLIKLRWSASLYWLAVIFFAMATPIGIFIGMRFIAAVHSAVAIVSCFSAGIFIYISLPHILMEELEAVYGSPLLKCLSYTSGIVCALMTSMIE